MNNTNMEGSLKENAAAAAAALCKTRTKLRLMFLKTASTKKALMPWKYLLKSHTNNWMLHVWYIFKIYHRYLCTHTFSPIKILRNDLVIADISIIVTSSEHTRNVFPCKLLLCMTEWRIHINFRTGHIVIVGHICCFVWCPSSCVTQSRFYYVCVYGSWYMCTTHV